MTTLQPHDYACEGVTLLGELATPAGPGPHPAVVVMHSGLGIGPLERSRAQDLAQAGYVALVADMYGFEPERDAAFKALALLQEDPRLLRARVVAAYDAIRALPQADPARICAIGFCFGGQCVLELARSGADVASVVSFHGLLRAKAPAEPGAVKAKVLAITGALDPYAPRADVEVFQKEMTQAGADWQMTLYSTGWHAFTNRYNGERTDIAGVRYDPLLDKLSWAQSGAFLEATLEGR